ncbi:MAG: isoleucine--tRNA ligase [Planctomycetota bacterium]
MTTAKVDSMTYRDVPTKVDFPALEREILAFWEAEHCFEKLRQKIRGGPKWSFLDGPITANNPMGVHHAWGRAYKDIFQRYHAMRGHEQRYQNGFDCQGLWVEVEVEKELGFKSKRDIEEYGIGPFVERCKERVRKYAAVQTQQSIRLGYWMDWNDSYYTMSDVNNYTIWSFLKKCHERGFIYRGLDVMPWCARCGTGLSQHEIATEGYRELTHPGVTLRFPIRRRDGGGRERESLLVWTTTPWTLAANVAAAVHPEKTYVRVRHEGEALYLVKALAATLDGASLEGASIEAELRGRDLLGLEYAGPFDELEAQRGVTHRVIPWAEVSETEGTGIVHIAPGCGAEDFGLSKEHHLAVLAPIDESGIYVEGYGEFTGKSALDVGPRVIALLREKGILVKSENYTHSYPVCWRCNQELVFRLVDEWYIRMNELRHEIIRVTKETEWIPPYGKEREIDWLLNMHDWMISKKRYWGLALPIWQCSRCGWFDVIGGCQELSERAIEGWEAFEGQSPHRPWVDAVKIACGKCGAKVARIPDVGNPWLDAGIVPYSTMRYAEDREYWQTWFPADLITESFPGQFRNWFYAILAMSTVMEKRAPFKKLFGYALMRDQTGREMHKSWGNAIEFNEAAEKAGVDAMRWLYAAHNPEQNLNFGYGPIDEARRKFLTLWNVYSFFVTYAKLDGFVPGGERLPVAQRAEMDRWILSNLQHLIEHGRRGYEDYSVHLFMREVERFIDELSTWYVRRGRRRYWKSEDDQDKRAAYETLHAVLTTLARLLAPIIPFATEAIYQNLVRSHDKSASESVHLTSFPEVDSSLIDPALSEAMELVLQVVELGRFARQKVNLKVRQPLAVMRVKLPSPALQEKLAPFVSEILDELNVKVLEYHDSLAHLVQWHVTLDAKKLGPKLGPRFQEVLRTVKGMPPQAVAAAVGGGEGLRVATEAGIVALDPGDVQVAIAGTEGWTVAEGGGTQVALSTVLTDELVLEGAVRDLVRHVQTLRKEAGFDVADRIVLEVKAPASGTLVRAVEAGRDYLTGETLAVELRLGEPRSPHTKAITLSGEEIVLGVARVGS